MLKKHGWQLLGSLMVLCMLLCTAVMPMGTAGFGTTALADEEVNQSAAFGFSVSTNQVAINRTIELTVAAEGADLMRVSSVQEGWGQDDTWMLEGGEEQVLTKHYDRAGTYVYVAEALYGDIWAEIGRETINVTSVGKLSGLEELPDVMRIEPGVDFTIRWNTVPNAEWYNVWLEGRAAGSWWDAGDIGDARSVTIPGSELNDGVYALHVHAGADRLDGFEHMIMLIVSENQGDVPSLAAGKVEAVSQERVDFSASAQGATLIAIYEDGWRWGEIRTDGTDHVEWTMEFSSGMHLVSARACYDEVADDYDFDTLNWSAMSECVAVQVSAKSTSAVPQISVPAAVVKGEWLPVQIVPGDDECWFDLNAGEGAYHDWGAVRVQKSARRADSEPFTAYLPTNNLNLGLNHVMVTAAGPGKDWSEGFLAVACFEVVDAVEQQPYFTVSETYVLCEDPVHMMFAAPGADEQRVNVYEMPGKHPYADWYWNDGEARDVAVSFNHSGTYLAMHEARFDGEWTTIGEETVTVDCIDQLAASSLDMSLVHNLGEDMVVGVSGDERTLWYHLIVADQYGNHIYERQLNEAGEYVIPGDVFADEGYYQVELYAHAYQYSTADVGQRVYVCAEKDSNVQLRISQEEVVVNEEFRVYVDAPGAKLVRVYANNGDWVEFRLDENGHGEETWCLGSGTHVIIARVCYDEIGDEYDGNELNFAGANEQPVIITVYNVGNPGVADVSIPGEVAYGNFLPVTITPNGDADRFDIHVRRADNRDEVGCWGYGNYNGETFTVQVPTTEMEIGVVYRAEVLAGGYGMDWAPSAEVEFIVTENDVPYGLAVSGTELNLWDEVFFTFRSDAAFQRVCIEHCGEGMHADWWWCDTNIHADRTGFGNAGDYELYAMVSDDDENWERTGDSYLIHVSSDGALEPCYIWTERSYYTAGEDVEVFYGGDERAEHFHINVLQHQGSEVYQTSYQRGGSFVVPANRFTESGYYNLNVYSSSNRYNASWNERTIYVDLGERDENLTITVSNAEPLVHEDVCVTVEAPGAAFVRMQQSRDEMRDIWLDENGVGKIWTSFDSGEQKVIFRACYDLENEGMGPGNVFTMNVVSTGEAMPADVSVPAVVRYGDFIPATITPANGENLIDVRIIRVEEGNDFAEEMLLQSFQSPDGQPITVYLPTANLHVGVEYRVDVLAAALGMDWVRTDTAQGHFTVTEGETEESFFKLSASEVSLYQPVSLVIHTPGAEAQHVVAYHLPEHDVWGEWYWNCWEDYYTNYATDSYAESADILFEAYVCRNGEWERLGEQELHVVSEGALEPGYIEAEHLLTKDNDLAVTFHVDEKTEWIDMWIDDHQNGETIYRTTLRGQTELIIPASVFEHTGTYSINAHAKASKLDCVFMYSRVVVYDMIDENVTLAVDRTEALAHETVCFTIHAPGATYARLYVDGDGWCDTDMDENGDAEIYWEYDRGVYVMFARVSYDELDEEYNPDELNYGGISNSVVMEIDGYGAASPADVYVSDVVERGMPLEVIIEPTEMMTDYQVCIRCVDEDQNDWNYFIRNYTRNTDESFKLVLPTRDLEVGRHYRVAVGTCSVGYDWTWNEWDQAHFTVVELENDVQVSLYVTPTQVVCGQPFYVMMVNGPDVINERLVFEEVNTGDRWEDWELWEEGRWLDREFNFDRTGLYAIHCEIRYTEDDDAWISSETCYLNVTAIDTLAQPELTMPQLVKNGDMLEITVGAVEHGEEYHLSIDGEDYHWDDRVEPGVVSIDTSDMPEGRYWVNLNVNAYNYSVNDNHREFEVYGENDENVTITADRTEALAREAIRFTVDAPGATLARVHLDMDCWYYVTLDENGHGEIWWEYGQGTYPVYARVTYDEVDEDCDLDELNYGGVSNMITVEVTAYGDASPANVAAPETIVCGEPLKVSIEPTSLETDYHVRIRCVDEDMMEWEFCFKEFHRDNDESFTVLLPTFDLEVGRHYRVEVLAGTYGYNWASNDWDQAHFTVTEADPDLKVSLSIYPTEVVAQEAVHILMTNGPDAVNERLIIENLDTGDCWEDWDGWNGRGLDRDYSFDHAGRYAIRCEVRYTEDDDAWISSDTFVVNVTDYGQLAQPEFAAPSTIKRGDLLEINVEPVENAEFYVMWIDNGNDRYWGNEEVQVGTVYVDVSDWEEGCYYINLYAGAYGYSSSHICKPVMVYEDFEASGTLTCLSDQPVEECAGILFSLDAPGATFARLYVDQNAWIDVWPEEFERFGWDWTFEAGEHFVQAMLYDGDVLDGTGECLQEQDFTGKTNYVQVTSIHYDEQTEQPMFSVPESVIYGETLGIPVEPQSELSWADLHIYRITEDEVEEIYYDRKAPAIEAFTFLVPTDMLEINADYVVLISAWRPEHAVVHDWDYTYTFHVDELTIPEGPMLTLPSDLKVIDDEAFAETALHTVMIPDGTQRIGSRAFANSGLMVAYIPSSVTDIADDAFDGCYDMIVVCEPESVAEQYARDRGLHVFNK